MLLPHELVDRLHRRGALDRPADLVLAELARSQHGRVATWQLGALGVTRSEVARRVAAGRLHREHRGVYAVGHPGRTAESRRMAAVLACGPRSLLCSRALVHHHRLLDGDGPVLVDVLAAGRSRGGHPGIRLHLPREVGRAEVAVVRGVPCTTVERMLVDFAAVATDAELATVVHRAQVRHLVVREPLQAQLQRRAKGVGRVRELLEPEGPDLREEFERRFHRFVRRGRWPLHEPNVRLWTPLGELRADALWRDHGFAMELDSWRHHRERDAFETDRERVIAADLIGLRLIRITWRMLNGRPEVVADLLDRHVGRSSAPR